jgi:hypothetical protein
LCRVKDTPDVSDSGAGWSLSTVNRLVDIAGDNNYPVGQLRHDGTGDWRFYEDMGSGTFDSAEVDL